MKIELHELGNGFHVDIKDPKRMSWKEQKQITASFKDESVSSQLDVAEQIAISLIKGGYLLDENDRPISFPLTAETVNDVPAVVIEKVASKFAELKAENTSKN